MSQIMRLRVILDTEDDVFRDIEIATDAPLMHLHLKQQLESTRTAKIGARHRLDVAVRHSVFLDRLP